MADIGNRLGFESLSPGHSIVTGDLPADWSVAGSGGTLTAVAKTWDHGAMGAQIDNATAQRAFLKSGSFGTAVACQWLYFILDSISATAIIPSGGTGSANWRLNANRSVQARNNTSVVGTVSSTGLIAADGTTVYRAEHSTNPGAGTQQLKILAGDDNTTPLYDSGSQTLVGTARTNFSFGATAAAAGVKMTVLAAGAVDTAWAGPIPSAGAGSLSGSGSLSAAKVVVPLFTYPLGTGPWYASHRGAIGPEETQGSYDRSLVVSPKSGLEGDVQSASNGYVLSHDATTDRTADASSPFPSSDITTLTVAQYKTTKIKDLSGRGFAAENGMSLDDWFARYGPMGCWLIPELKTGSDAVAFAAYVIGTGYANKTVVQAFSRPTAETLAAAGLEVAHLIASGGDTTWSAIKAAGINHVVRNSSLWTTGDITAAKAAGLTAGVFTIETTTDRDTQIANGINGFIFTDYPDLLKPDLTGTSGLSGSGTLTAAGTPRPVGSAALSGTGTLSAPGAPAVSVAAALSGSGSLAASGTPRPTAAPSLSGSGALVASGAPAVPGAVALGGTGTLTVAGTPAATRSAALSGGGTLAAAGAPAVPTSAALSGSGTLAAVGTPTLPPAAAALSGSGTLTATGTAAASTSVALGGSGTLSASGGNNVTGTAALSGAGTLASSGSPRVSVAANLSGSGSLAAAGGSLSQSTAAGFSGAGALIAAGGPQASIGAVLSGAGTLTAQVVALALLANATLSGAGQLVAVGVPGPARSTDRDVTILGVRDASSRTTVRDRSDRVLVTDRSKT